MNRTLLPDEAAPLPSLAVRISAEEGIQSSGFLPRSPWGRTRRIMNRAR